MNGNLSGTYESFLARCIGGIRKEQEAFQELANLTNRLKDLENEGNASGLKNQPGCKAEAELAEAYLKGKEALDKEGDMYSVLSPLRNLVKYREEYREEMMKKQEAASAEAQHRKEMFENRKVAKSKLFKYSFTSFMLAGIFALCVFIYLTESAPIWKTSCCWGIDWCAIFFISCILHMKRKILPCLGGKRRCSDWDWRDESMRSDRFPARFVAIVLFGPGLYGLWHGFSELPEGTFPVLSSIWTAGATAFYSLLIFKGDEFSWCYRTSLAFAIAWGGGIVWRVVKYFMGN